MSEIIAYLPVLLPFMVIHWVLAVVALVHIFKHTCYKVGNRLIWCLVVVLIQIIGPIIYFVFGRSDEG